MAEDSQEFEKAKIRYFTKQTFAHLPEMRRAKEAGLFPKKEGWLNVVEHIVVEAEAVDVLAEALGVSEEDRKNLVTAAMLHDVYKRKETELARKGTAADFVEQSEALQSKWLRNLGYSDEIVELSESVGHPSLMRFQNLDQILLIKKIIHYVDDITLNNDLVLLDDRINYLETNTRYAEVNQQGMAIFGKPYFTVQREISKKIEQEFAQKLGLEDPTQLPFWTRDRILKRIAKNE